MDNLKGQRLTWLIMVYLSYNICRCIVLFLDHDIEQAKNMKLLLCTFEQISSLKINFHNTKIFFSLMQKIVNISIHTYLAES